MTELMLRSQHLVQTMADLWNSLPFWLALGLLFSPTLLSLIARDRIAIFSTAILSTASLVALVATENSRSAVAVAIATFSASVIFAAFGIRERRLRHTLIELEARVSHVDEQLASFLTALERRSDMIDNTADEARRIFEDARKQFHKAAFPQVARTTASMSDPAGSTNSEDQ